MATPEDAIPSLLLPLSGYHLLIPQATVAEVIKRPDADSQAEAPAWLRGVFQWREEALPLISYEGMCGVELTAADSSARAVVLYALEDIANVVFYAVELQATPHPVTVTRDLLVHKPPVEDHDLVACSVTVDGHQAVVPALKNIEAMIRDYV